MLGRSVAAGPFAVSPGEVRLAIALRARCAHAGDIGRRLGLQHLYVKLMSMTNAPIVLSAEVTAMLIACETAIDDGKLIERQSRRDKEFPFQNWFKARLEE